VVTVAVRSWDRGGWRGITPLPAGRTREACAVSRGERGVALVAAGGDLGPAVLDLDAAARSGRKRRVPPRATTAPSETRGQAH